MPDISTECDRCESYTMRRYNPFLRRCIGKIHWSARLLLTVFSIYVILLIFKCASQGGCQCTDTQGDNSETLRQKRFTTLPQNNELFVNISKNEDTRRRYLAPIHVYLDGGPNRAFWTFRRELRLALLQNRTIVSTPFRVYDRLETQMYSSVSMRRAFDEILINQIVPVVSMKEFYEECKDELIPKIKLKPFDVIQDKEVSNSRRYFKTRDAVGEIGRDYPFHARVSSGSTPEENSKFLAATQGVRCLSVYFDEDVRFFRSPADEELYQEVDNHLSWSPYVSGLVDGVYDAICDGTPFAVVHWRNRTGEKCLNGSYWAPHVCKPTDYFKLSVMSKTIDVLVNSLIEYIQSRGHTCVYIAHPPYQQEFVNRMKKEFPGVVYTLKRLVQKSHKLMKLQNKNDNFVLSLVEQEIAVRAHLFIGWRESSWTKMVSVMRRSLGKEIVPLPVERMSSLQKMIWCNTMKFDNSFDPTACEFEGTYRDY